MEQLRCIGERPPAERIPTVRLSFCLPPALLLRAQAGRYAPTLHGCRLDVGTDGTVTIGGYDGLVTHSTDIVIEQALRFLVTLAERGSAPLTFAAGFIDRFGEIGQPARAPDRLSIAVNARAVMTRPITGSLLVR
ncbi:MAG: hypothetical protein ACREHV_01070 [Rhizomicrobium sp.]